MISNSTWFNDPICFFSLLETCIKLISFHLWYLGYYSFLKQFSSSKMSYIAASMLTATLFEVHFIKYPLLASKTLFLCFSFFLTCNCESRFGLLRTGPSQHTSVEDSSRTHCCSCSLFHLDFPQSWVSNPQLALFATQFTKSAEWKTS